jgi:hypothetical protein
MDNQNNLVQTDTGILLEAGQSECFFGEHLTFKYNYPIISENNIYIWRTIPYRSNDDAEDRIIIGSNKSINILSKLYFSDIYNIYHLKTAPRIFDFW